MFDETKMKKGKIYVKLNSKRVALIVDKINKVLDDENIFSEIWTNQVFKALLLSNYTKEGIKQLCEDIENTVVIEENGKTTYEE